MSSARETILARLRQTHTDANVQTCVEQHQRGPLPALHDTPLAQFINKMTQNAASVDNVQDDAALIASIQQFLNQHQLPGSLCVVNHPVLAGLPWPGDIQAEQRQVKPGDVTVLSVADCALAETGSVVMLSGAQTPTEANFLPDNFICVVNQADIICYMEDLWQRLRQQQDTLAKVVNIISGPSRTADVEQTIQLGAHGPRRMHVIIRS